jgi:glucokinase
MRLPHDHLIARRIQAPVMRSLNGIELLSLVGEHGPISRASLAKLSRLSKPTVSSQVETLIRQGWVLEVGPGESGERGGKKPMLVKFNADAGRLFAAGIDAAMIRVAVSNLEGVILERNERPIDRDRHASVVMAALTAMFKTLVRKHAGAGDLRVMSVAAPGRVDVRRGTVLQAGNLFNWSEVPVRAPLEKSFGMPVFVDNDVNMATLGEIHFGVARGVKDVVLVRLDTGIGAGIVIRGRLLHGSHWAAGEIAHMVLDTSRDSADWKVRGYLESMVGSDRILSELQPLGQSSSSFESLDKARLESARARDLYEEISRHLGIAVANLVCAFDPGLVILQGNIFRIVEDRIRQVISSAVPWETRIVISDIAGEAVLLGVVAAARAQAYERIARMLDESTPAHAEYAAAPR